MIEWLKHAEENLLERQISREIVDMTILDPELIVPDRIHHNRQVYMRRYFDELLQNQMLCRVVIEKVNEIKLVVTVYKTSQIKRYFKI